MATVRWSALEEADGFARCVSAWLGASLLIPDKFLVDWFGYGSNYGYVDDIQQRFCFAGDEA
jgi:hypothetical protein